MKNLNKYVLLMLSLILVSISICFVPIRISKLIPIVEERVEKELGVKVHIDKLILQIGPLLKIKTPLVHVMYEDGQKFAQLNNIKIFINWFSLLKNEPVVSSLTAKKVIFIGKSNDKFLSSLLENLNEKGCKYRPNIKLKEYHITYTNMDNNDKYTLDGQNFVVTRVLKAKNSKISTKGSFSINKQSHLTYDISILPNIDISDFRLSDNIISYLEQIKNLYIYSDIIADVELYKNKNNDIQASGFVNIDNISILDISKKTPRSFVYLTLWGDKASILSNIYTSANKKVYIEGIINNSKKMLLDLKVKAEDINLNDLYQKLRIFTDFNPTNEIKSVKGALDANFTLKGDINKIKSNGFIKINNAEIVTENFEINKINSDIDLSNNEINIKKMVGYIKNSPITIEGKIDKEIDVKLSINEVELKSLLPSKLGIQTGIISLLTHFTGTFDNIIHKEKFLIDKLHVLNDNVDLSLDSIKYDTNQNNIAYINNIVCKTKYAQPVKVPLLKFIVDNDTIKFHNTSMYMPNSNLSLNGEFNKETSNFILKMNGFINSKDINAFNKYSTRYPIKLNFYGNKTSQNINSQILLEKTDIFEESLLLNIVTKLEKNQIKFDDVSLLSFTGDFQDDLKANLKGNKKISIYGIIEDLKNPILKNIRLYIPQFLNINFQNNIAQIKGDIFLNGNIKTPEIIGQILIQNLYNQALQLSLNNCSLDFNKNNLIFNAPQLKINDSSMGINALVSTDFSKEILIKNINIKSKYLNTDTILMHKDNPLLTAYPIKIQEGKFYSERLFANIYQSPLYLVGFTSEISLIDNVLVQLKNITSELYNGKLLGKIDYNLHDEHFNVNVQARGVSAEPIFNIVSQRKDSISGLMDFDLNLKGELISKQSLNGNVKFIVNNGRMSTLGKLEHLLYAQNVIADNMLRTTLNMVAKAITLKDTGLFKYLRGDIDIKNGIANINMLQSQGPLMSLFIKGLYNPTNDFAKLIVLGRLSDEVLSGLGAFGDFSFNKLLIMLTGEEGKQAVLPEDFEKIPQLTAKNTKEFRAIINGVIDKTSSVKLFNWIAYSTKSLKQKEVPIIEQKVPEFVDKLPY